MVSIGSLASIIPLSLKNIFCKVTQLYFGWGVGDLAGVGLKINLRNLRIFLDRNVRKKRKNTLDSYLP